MRKRGYNKHTILTCIGIGVASYIVFALFVMWLETLDRTFNELAYWWTAAWWVGSTFAIINGRESSRDRDAIRRVPILVRADLTAADWYVRLDVVQVLICLVMLASGLASLFEAARVHIATGLMIAGVISSFSQAWSTADRMRLKRIIKEDREDAKRKRGQASQGRG